MSESSKLKTSLTPAELVGFNLLVEKGKKAAALSAVYDDDIFRINNTDKYYLCQQLNTEAESKLRQFLMLCGVDPEKERIMEDGTIIQMGTPDPTLTGMAAHQQAATQAITPAPKVQHPPDPDKQEFDTLLTMNVNGKGANSK